MRDFLVELLYLWTQDAKVPVEEMRRYVQTRLPGPLVETIDVSDKERLAIAQQLAEELRAERS